MCVSTSITWRIKIHTTSTQRPMRPLSRSVETAPFPESESQQNSAVRLLVSTPHHQTGCTSKRINHNTILSSTSRNMPRNMSQLSWYPFSASLFHLAIHDGRYFIHVKNSTRYFPGTRYWLPLSTNPFTFANAGSSVEVIEGVSYTMVNTVDALALHRGRTFRKPVYLSISDPLTDVVQLSTQRGFGGCRR